jgi:hypothetical protein
MKLFPVIILIIAAILISVPVSAVIYDDSIVDFYYDAESDRLATGATGGVRTFDHLYFSENLLNYVGLYYVGSTALTTEVPATTAAFVDAQGLLFKLYDGSTEVGSGRLDYYVSTSRDDAGYRDIDASFWFDELDIQTMYESGNSSFRFTNNQNLYVTVEGYGAPGIFAGYDRIVAVSNSIGNVVRHTATSELPAFARVFSQNWEFKYYTDARLNQLNTITFTPNIITNWSVNVGGTVDYKYVTENVVTLNYGAFPLNLSVVSPFDENFFYNISIGESVNDINIFSHVWSTGDNSLIAGVTVNYTAVDDSDQVLQTLTYGEGIVVLQKDTPYYFTATADGFRSQSNIPDVVEFSASTQHGSYLVPIVGNASAGNGTLNFHVSTYTSSGSTIALEGAIIEVNGNTLITNDAGFAHIDVNKTTAINYAVSKNGYQSVTRIYTPSWPPGYEYIDEWVTLRADGQILPGEPSPEETLDTRSNVQKADSALNILFENIEMFATLAVIILLMSFIKWIK